MSMPEPSEEEVRKRAKEHLDLASRRVSMALLLRGNGPEGVVDNGTASFLHLPGGKFIVTNHHVWDEYRSQRDNDPNFRLALTGEGFQRPIDISTAKCISENADLDLAVLDFDAEFIESMGKQYVNLLDGYEGRPSPGDQLVTVGFPGMRRYVVTMPHPQTGQPMPVLRHESISL